MSNARELKSDAADAQSGEPLYFHVDMDAFYVSVEELENPSLRDKPVVVGAPPDRRGVVAAASYAARKYGVHSAMPSRTAYRLCPHAIFLRPRFDLYHHYSSRVQQQLREFAPQVDMVSVDEAYLDVSGCERLYGKPLHAAALLRERIVRSTGLSCSIGASRSRLVSKIASDLAKPRGILWVLPRLEAAFLAPLPVSSVPGVGKVTNAALERIGIRRIGDILKCDSDLLEERFGSYAQALRRKALGEDAGAASIGFGAAFGANGDIDDDHSKSISHENTFGEDTAVAEVLDSTLAELVQNVARRLRAQHAFARTIHLKLRDPKFVTRTRAKTLTEPTDLDSVLLSEARALFRANHKPGRALRLLGFGVSGLEPNPGQLNLLEQGARDRWQQALAAADRIRQRHGSDSVRLASSLGPPENEQS